MALSKILLVDDTRLFLELEKNFLKLSPVTVITASSGEEALETAASERPDLIFLDIHMPGMGGIACCARLKSDPELRSIPVIMVTASGKEVDLELCRKAGCDDYVTKPVDRRIFLEKARNFLRAVERRENRISCHLPVTCLFEDRSLAVECEDLSIGGMYVSCDMEINQKTGLLLSFVINGSQQTTVETQGRIAWLNTAMTRCKPSMPLGFGVEFVDIPEQAKGAIRTFIDIHR